MPGGNRMGPMGTGSRTGRGAGFCGGFGVPGHMRSGYGAGFGGGWGGFGRGMTFGAGLSWGDQYGHPYQPDSAMERDYLASQAGVLRNQLSAIEKRLAELEAGKKETV